METASPFTNVAMDIQTVPTILTSSTARHLHQRPVQNHVNPVKNYAGLEISATRGIAPVTIILTVAIVRMKQIAQVSALAGLNQ